MKKISIDHMTFEGEQAVLDHICEPSLLSKIKLFLNKELEIPVGGVLITGVCLIALISFVPKKEVEKSYPIVVIDSGGVYEIY